MARRREPLRTLTVAALALASAPVAARDRLPAYDDARWSQRDGLPQSTVTGVAPAPDGALWLSTFGGLARFDGQRITPVLPSTDTLARVSRLATIAVDAQDPSLLWVGTVDNGLWTFDGAEFAYPEQPPILAHAVVYALAQHDGTLVVASNEGAFSRDPSGVWSRESDVTAFHAAFAPNGDRFVCLLEGRYQIATAAGATIHEPPPSDNEVGACLGAVADPEGDWWMLTGSGFWFVEPDGRAQPVRGIDVDARWGQHPTLDASGRLWVGDATGAVEVGAWDAVKTAVRAGEPVAPREHPVGAPRAWHADPSGALWVGTLGEGLARLSPLGFSRITERPPPGSRGTGPLDGRGESAWFTIDCFDLQYDGPDGPRRSVPLEPSPTGERTCVDALWAGRDEAVVARGSELLAGGPGGLRIVADLPERETNGAVAYLERRSTGGSWVGTEHGRLWTFDGDTLAPHTPQLPDGTGVVLDVLERADGTVAIGHARGVCLSQDAGWRCLDEADGLVPGAIRHLAEDDAGTLWLASYGGGLGWLDGDALGRVRSGPTGVPDRFLSAVTFDAHGSAWLQGNAGVTRVRTEELQAMRTDPDRALRTELVPVGEANGWLRQSAALLDDGQLWLAGVEGITVVDTAAFDRPTGAPPPQLASAAVGDVSLPLDADPAPVPPDAFRRLEVRYAAPTLHTNEEVWFEHRLVSDGAVAAWVQAADARTAVYGGLTPGSYRFEVRGVGLDGRRTPAATLAFRITPHWWERGWVLLLALFGLLGAAALVQGARTWAIARRNRELHAEIARRIQAEQLLQAREARFRQVFDQAANGFLLHDEDDGRCILANPEACRLFGRPQEQILATSRDALGLPSPDDSAGPEPVICTRADGTRFPARVDHVRYQGRLGPRVLTSVFDLTALVESQNQERRLRRQLAGAQRLEALGRLAGGVAHDMNNVLAAVATNVELLGEMADPRERDAPACLADARDSVERGSKMVQQLLAFSRRQDLEVSDVDPTDLVERLARMLRQLLPEDRELEVEAKPTGRVRINRTQLEQVVLNLVVNASDAVGRGGRITLRVGPGPEQDTVRIEVQDNGPGIDDVVLEHIFEPFFTTKDPGHGTGLGLPTAKGVVEEAGGTITVDTGPRGTRFRVTLPRSAGAAQAAAPREAAPPRGDGRLIVLVDDDAGVRRSLKRQLVRAGWAVEDYEDPLAARDRLTGDAPPPSLLVTDVVMPALNGRQLVTAARRAHPALRALYISGYTADVLGDQIDGPDSLLQKPFSRDTLLRAVFEQAAPADPG